MAGGAFVLAAVPPGEETFYPRCLLHSLTGLHCPGCGTTRALHALLNGHVAQAIAYNALILLVLPVVIWSVIREKLSPDRTWSEHRSRHRATICVWLFVALLLIFGVLRNLPWYPLTLLAPHEL